jgi:transcriptional regulator with XRE-family HTH domain
MNASSSVPGGYDDLLSVLGELPVICRETRRRKRLSMREAGEQAGISPSTFCRVEARTGDPSLSAIVAILRWAAS